MGGDLVGEERGKRRKEKEGREEVGHREGETDDGHTARRDSKCLGCTTEEVAKPGVRRVD